MKCRNAMVGVVSLFTLVAGSSAHGQTSVLVGIGSTIPVGSLTSSGPFAGANTGWQATIGIRRALGSSGIALGARAFYGANGYESPGEEDSKLAGLTALGMWSLTEGAVSPFLWSEAGFLSHRYSSDSGGLFFGGPTESRDEAILLSVGGGMAIPIGSAELLLLGGYAHGLGVFDNTQYFLLTSAASFTIG